jgi:hypothetical protein
MIWRATFTLRRWPKQKAMCQLPRACLKSAGRSSTIGLSRAELIAVSSEDRPVSGLGH